MTSVNRFETTPPSTQYGANPPDPETQDATAQAVADLGYLAWLARSYSSLEATLASTTDPAAKKALEAQINAVEAEFNQTMALFHVDASGNVTFTYTDAQGNTKTVQIPDNDTNHQLIVALQSMLASYTDISKYLTFADASTNNPLLTCYQWLSANSFTFENYSNDATLQDMCFFMMGLAGSPIGDLSGDLDTFLEQGFENGAILPQSLVFAQTLAAILANTKDPNLAAALNACLSVQTKDDDYTALEQQFQQITSEPDWQKNYQNRDAWYFFESRFWPYYAPTPSQGHIFKTNAVPLTKLAQDDHKDKRR